MRLLHRLLLLIVFVGLGFAAVLFLVYETAPKHKGSEKHFDTLIVLGTPSKLDGTPSLEMTERVNEAVREYHAGAASHIIMTGAAAHNHFIESQVMADDAIQQGVPREAVVVEAQAKDTIQNIWYSYQIMQANGWHSAEVISSPYHLPRTGLILTHYEGPLAFDWRTRASHWPPAYGVADKWSKQYHEALGLVKLRVEGFRRSPFLPNP